MPLWEKPIDKEREVAAMGVMASHFGLDFKQTAPQRPVDFYSVQPAYVCEHKYRNYPLPVLLKMGNIYLEVAKYNALVEAQKKRGDVALFVVTTACGRVIYCKVDDVDTRETIVATRRDYRGAGDDDRCYMARLDLFKIAK